MLVAMGGRMQYHTTTFETLNESAFAKRANRILELARAELARRESVPTVGKRDDQFERAALQGGGV